MGATEPSRPYTIYLTITALAGWALTSYDMNLLVLTIPDISRDLGLSQSQVGSLIFFVTAAQFVATPIRPRAFRHGCAARRSVSWAR